LAIAYNNRGAVAQHRKQSESALADYDRAIELDPNLASAYCNRAAIELDQTHLDRALTDFNRAIQLKPRLSIAYVGRGRTEHAKDQLDAALKDFDRRSERERGSVNKSGSSLFGVGTGEEKQETPKKL
jgi:tetratricopeptide (TPR) repeat protein